MTLETIEPSIEALKGAIEGVLVLDNCLISRNPRLIVPKFSYFSSQTEALAFVIVFRFCCLFQPPTG